MQDVCLIVFYGLYRNKSGIWGWRSEKSEVVSGYEAKVIDSRATKFLHTHTHTQGAMKCSDPYRVNTVTTLTRYISQNTLLIKGNQRKTVCRFTVLPM